VKVVTGLFFCVIPYFKNKKILNKKGLIFQ